MAAVPSGAAPGVYKARRPQASPLFRLVSDHFRVFTTRMTSALPGVRGRSLLVANSEHIYQVAIIAGWSHARIAVTHWFAMAVCGAIACWFRVTPRT